VLRGGKIIEAGPTEQIFADPHEDYTRALLASVPTANREAG
jgi:peptide/nickel transport system ATP-binding protein